MNAWRRFIAWINESKYGWGDSQYLEEHIGGVDLYFPVEEGRR